MGYGKNNYEKQTQQAEKIKRANFFALSCEWDLNITVGRLPDAHKNYYKGYFGKSQTILQRKRKLKVHFQKKDDKRKMKTIKRLLWVLLCIVVLAVIGYFIYTGCQL